MSTVFIRLPACLPPFKRVHSFPLFMFNNKYRKPLTEIFTVHVSSYTCVHLISHEVFMQRLIIEMAKLLTQLPPPWQCDSQCVALASVKAGDPSHGTGLGTRILVSLAEPGPLPCVARLQDLSVLSVTHSQPQPIRVQHPGRVSTLSQSESSTIMHWPMAADH